MRASVALTERFIHVMESEHRELGLGDPTLGKTVRKLVGMLARRTQLWRELPGRWTRSDAGEPLQGRRRPRRAGTQRRALRAFARGSRRPR